jgi:NO-binding membrane sensor protein with MHYT domain
MGGIAIWPMHYIGNYSIVLGDGQDDLQIVYSLGFTTFSFFLPIAINFLVFCVVRSDETVSIPRIIIGGMLAGFGVCGMHCMGQVVITNYSCEYKLGFVILSIFIGCVDSIMALGMFFKFRSSWDTSWWK